MPSTRTGASSCRRSLRRSPWRTQRRSPWRRDWSTRSPWCHDWSPWRRSRWRRDRRRCNRRRDWRSEHGATGGASTTGGAIWQVRLLEDPRLEESATTGVNTGGATGGTPTVTFAPGTPAAGGAPPAVAFALNPGTAVGKYSS